MNIKAFCFNPFSENTYVIYNESGVAWIIDPGCSEPDEEKSLVAFLESEGLRLERILLTHAHIDHIMGLEFLYRTFNLKAEMHEGEKQVLESAPIIAGMYGISYRSAPHETRYIVDNQILAFGSSPIKCLYTPGHSPASISYFLEQEKILISGDVLFEGSIGRTDLPGGDYDTLISSIKTRLFPLGNEVQVYPGHGGITTIGQEKLTNPFLN
jgi:hydroxyacylglutathione hydrolase